MDKQHAYDLFEQISLLLINLDLDIGISNV
jgi:hypothetical protein